MNKTFKIILYIYIILFVSGLIIDFIETKEEPSNKINIVREHNPVPIVDRDIAKFNFHAETVKTIGIYYAPIGYKYLVVTYRIKNDGHSVVWTSSDYWRWRANGIDYTYDFTTYDGSINHVDVKIINGGDITNQIVFLIRDDVTIGVFYPLFNYTLICRDKTLLIPGYMEEYEGYESWVLNSTTKHAYDITSK